ncbi:hypothetical protein GCM10027435_03070 [Haloparvum alkalitolerans]|uniref:hypothetical protein n=1 Tax=Haloparvum alkalitolerans TaxID=1042953 RepID=UPI003CF46311
MNSRWFLGLSLLVIIAVGVGVAGASVTASDEFSLAMDSSIDVQPQTVTIEGSTYSFASIGTTSADSTFDVSATGPDGTSFRIHLRDSEKQIATTGSRMEGSGVETFDASELTPGTYMILISADGSYEAALPLVVDGYDTSLSAPTTVEPGETVAIQVTTTQTDESAEPITQAGLVTTHEGEERNISMTHVGDGTYEATVTFEEEGTHSIYAGVRGESEINGEKQFVGLSDRSTVKVEADDGSTDDGSSGSGAGGPTETPIETDTTTEETTATEEATPETTTTATSTQTETTTAQSTDRTESPTEGTESEDSTTTESGPITPSGTQTPEDKSGVDVPLRGVQLLLFTLLLGAGYIRFSDQ